MKYIILTLILSLTGCGFTVSSITEGRIIEQYALEYNGVHGIKIAIGSESESLTTIACHQGKIPFHIRIGKRARVLHKKGITKFECEIIDITYLD